MNYLAHAVLSGKDDDLLFGNFIGDFVKGRQWMKLPQRVGQGILLHRFIDDFTDNHPLSAEGRSLLRGSSGKYAGVALDIIYDHLLAANWDIYHPEIELLEFSEQVYKRLEAREDSLPDRAARMFAAMKMHNWLYHYKSIEGLRKSLDGVQRRTRFPNVFSELIHDTEPVVSRIEPLFHRFFPEICRSCSSKIISFADD